MSKKAKRISDSKYSQGSEYERSSKIYTLDQIPQADKKNDNNLLDVGCGTGLNSEYLVKKGYDVFGVDISSVATQKYCSKGLNGCVCNVPEGLPFKNDSFQLIFASEVIEHIDDTEQFLHELFSVLKPGGRLVLSTPNSAFWAYRIFALLGKTLTELQHPGHVRFFSKKGLLNELQNAGFSISKVSGRHMYLVMGEKLGNLFMPLLKFFGLEREYRFKTGTFFYQINKFAKKASRFWADTLIITAQKPADSE